MSHVASIELDIKDITALKTACADLGLEFMEGQKTYKCWGTGKTLDRLVGYQKIAGTLMPEGFTLEEMGQCEHAIRVKGKALAYEIGLATRRDGRAGYQLLCDISGAYEMIEKVGKDFGKLKQGYGVEVAVRAAKRAGFRIVKKTVRSDGSIAITTQR